MNSKKNAESNNLKSKNYLENSKEEKNINSKLLCSKKKIMRKAFILAELIFKKKF